MKEKTKSILYISYDGIMEPLGRSQVLSYLENLSDEFSINLLTFEKKSDLATRESLDDIKEVCKEANIKWSYCTYHKDPTLIATIYDILIGFIKALYFSIWRGVNIVHIRSYIPGLMILPIVILLRKKLIFDMRGMWADEKADRGGWDREGRVYKFFKILEELLLKQSDHVITLTDESIKLLNSSYDLEEGKFTKIPTCVDTSLFKLKSVEKNSTIVFGHLGSVDTAYDIDPILLLLKKVSKFASARINFINRGSHEFIKERCAELKVDKNLVSIKSADRESLANQISEISIGCFFAKENLSIKASMPTKIGEFLSCGKPILCNSFNQDICELINNNQIGMLCDFSNLRDGNDTYQEIRSLLNSSSLESNCQNLSNNFFSLRTGVASYRKIYNSL
jgi:glycosyltransferase involved in cell wall biosynthesis